MKKFIEKLFGRLEELKLTQNPYDSYYEAREFEKTEAINSTNNKTIERIIEIANQLVEEYKPKTWADKIRNMSDEELADFMDGLMTDFDAGRTDILEWLQSKPEEETNVELEL